MSDDGKWRVAASRRVLKDRWISVRADDCITDAGVTIAPYYVLEYPDWVHVVALDANDNVLLIRQYRHGGALFSIELPAGMMDPDDADPLAAAARELLEETGCAGKLTYVGQNSPNPATHTNRIHTIVARDVVVKGPPADDPTERIETFWVSAPEALRMALNNELTSAIQLASLLTALARIGVARIDVAATSTGPV